MEKLDECYHIVKNHIKEYDSDVVSALYKHLSEKDADFPEDIKEKLVELQTFLVEQAEKHVDTNPLLSLVFLSFTAKFLLSASVNSKRDIVLERALMQADYNDVVKLPLWIVCKWKHLFANPTAKLYIYLPKARSITLSREQKSDVWDIVFKVGRRVVIKDALRFYVLSTKKIFYDHYEDDDNYIIEIKSPFVEYKIYWSKKHPVNADVEEVNNEANSEVA